MPSRADSNSRFVRCLIDLAPGGEQFMTVDHGQADVAFHHHPSGDVLFTLRVEAFGYDPEGTFVEWGGGHLTPDTAVVTLGSESEDGEEWFRYHLIDVRTGTIGGEMAVLSGSMRPAVTRGRTAAARTCAAGACLGAGSPTSGRCHMPGMS
ncbi:hypothetical protein [Streptomyces sp. NPDC059874]|uniref:hypothetical protein n=1 Tax=Streptomyces sp. NPDC059874 TaxID=3346983 RepID=UPI00365FC6B1